MTLETLLWERLEPHLIKGTPCLLSMGGKRGARIGVRPDTGRMFVQVPIADPIAVPPSPYADLSTMVLRDDEGLFFEVNTHNASLFREFHQFARLFVEDVEIGKRSVVASFHEALARWLDLGAKKELLTPEQQLGLYGELSVLIALIQSRGTSAATAWTGRNEHVPDRHDFRLNGLDLEVKSTRSARRVHVINGLKQLTPSLGHRLYVLSLRVEPAGMAEGASLADAVSQVRALVDGSPEEGFVKGQLEAAKYRDDDAGHYQLRLKLADLPKLIGIDQSTPQITEEVLKASLGAPIASRVSDVSYRADLEGLGCAQGTPEFSAVLSDFEVK